MRMRVQSLASLIGLSLAVSCGVGSRCGSDLSLLWLWHRAAAVALIQPLAWELPYAAGAALKSKKKKKNSSAPHSIPTIQFMMFPFADASAVVVLMASKPFH